MAKVFVRNEAAARILCAAAAPAAARGKPHGERAWSAGRGVQELDRIPALYEWSWPMEELTPRQREVLALIRAHITETGYPPTRADIARSLGFRSANAAEEHLRARARKGAIEISKGTSRGLRLADDAGNASTRPAAAGNPGAQAVGTSSPSQIGLRAPVGVGAAGRREFDADNCLPVIGRVAAGQPILATEHVESQFEVAPSAFRPRADYLLRVRGDSMRDIGILDGDLLAVHAQPTADLGQVVVARIEDEVTVKRLARGEHANEIRLLAENPDFAPIVVNLRERSFSIEGLAVGVLRSRI